MNNLIPFVQFLSQNSLYRKIFSLSCNTYAIRALRLEAISPDQLLLHLKKLHEMPGETQFKGQIIDQQLGMLSWSSNEFRIFAWISVCYSYVQSKSFSRFITPDYQFLAEAFPHKSRTFIEYNLRVLSKEEYGCKRSKWTQEEIVLFKQIMKQENGEYRWTQVSLQLFIRSDKQFFQTPQKCREQWLNHLNPEVNKKKWSLDEDILLFRSVLKEGKKWSQISKIFNGARTEHMVKNRYKSILNKNQSKQKKVLQKKFCQNLLLSLQARLASPQMQNSKNSSFVNQSSEIVLEQCASFSKIQSFSQTKGELQQKNNFINEIQQVLAPLNAQQKKSVECYQVQKVCQTLYQSRKMQLLQYDIFEQVRYKSEEQLYIESLLS